MANSIVQVILAIIWFFAGVLFLTQTWSWYGIVASQITDGFYLALYWVGLLSMILLIVVLPPFTMILNAYKTEDIQ